MTTTEIAVEFGGVSIGKSYHRLGVRILRDALPLEEIDRIFCGRRISGKIAVIPPGEADQQRLPGMEDAEVSIDESFDTKQIGVKPHEYTLGFTFNRGSTDISELEEFAYKNGVVRVDSVKDLDDEATDDDEGWRDDDNEGEGDDDDDPNREAYTEGCEAAMNGKSKRCPYKKGDERRDYWQRGYEETNAQETAEA